MYTYNAKNNGYMYLYVSSKEIALYNKYNIVNQLYSSKI